MSSPNHSSKLRTMLSHQLSHQLSHLRKPPICVLLALIVVLSACNWFRDFDFARGERLTGGDLEQRAARSSRCVLAFHVASFREFREVMARALRL